MDRLGPLRIVHEDELLLVVDKPAGLAAHAAQGVDGPDLLALCRQGRPYVGLLHRLDREASGLMCLSKSPAANGKLQEQLESHALQRVYLALCAGHLPDGVRLVDRPVAERAGGRAALARRPGPGAKPARSHLRTVRRLGDGRSDRSGDGSGGRGGGATLVEVTLETGRKHQIRIHAASIGHPLLGDRRYGGPAAPRLALHAHRLVLRHPADGRMLELTAPWPDDLQALVEALGSRPPAEERR